MRVGTLFSMLELILWGVSHHVAWCKASQTVKWLLRLWINMCNFINSVGPCVIGLGTLVCLSVFSFVLYYQSLLGFNPNDKLKKSTLSFIFTSPLQQVWSQTLVWRTLWQPHQLSAERGFVVRWSRFHRCWYADPRDTSTRSFSGLLRHAAAAQRSRPPDPHDRNYNPSPLSESHSCPDSRLYPTHWSK